MGPFDRHQIATKWTEKGGSDGKRRDEKSLENAGKRIKGP